MMSTVLNLSASSSSSLGLSSKAYLGGSPSSEGGGSGSDAEMARNIMAAAKGQLLMDSVDEAAFAYDSDEWG